MDKYQSLSIDERAKDGRSVKGGSKYTVDEDGDLVTGASLIQGRKEAVSLRDALNEYIDWIDSLEEST